MATSPKDRILQHNYSAVEDDHLLQESYNLINKMKSSQKSDSIFNHQFQTSKSKRKESGQNLLAQSVGCESKEFDLIKTKFSHGMSMGVKNIEELKNYKSISQKVQKHRLKPFVNNDATIQQDLANQSTELCYSYSSIIENAAGSSGQLRPNTIAKSLAFQEQPDALLSQLTETNFKSARLGYQTSKLKFVRKLEQKIDDLEI